MAGEWICAVTKRNDPPKRSRSGGSFLEARKPRSGFCFSLGRGPLGAGRNLGDRFEDLRSDLVGVALRVRAAVFQIALVAVVDEGMWNADRSAAIGNAVGEGIDRRRLVLAGQAHVVIRTVDRDVVGAVALEGFHQLVE